jgi:hypothetical protein
LKVSLDEQNREGRTVEEPQVSVYPGGLDGEFPDGPPTVVVAHRGCRLVLRFAAGDAHGEGNVQELRLLPDTSKLEARVLRRFAPNAELYLAYARAAMRWLEPTDTPQERIDKHERFARAAQPLRDIGGPGRGLRDAFYANIAEQYRALVAEGEPHPIKTLGAIHHVTISAASRWVKGARDRGYIKEADDAR